MEFLLPILAIRLGLTGHVLRGGQFSFSTAQRSKIAALHLRYRRNPALQRPRKTDEGERLTDVGEEHLFVQVAGVADLPIEKGEGQFEPSAKNHIIYFPGFPVLEKDLVSLETFNSCYIAVYFSIRDIFEYTLVLRDNLGGNRSGFPYPFIPKSDMGLPTFQGIAAVPSMK